MIGLKSETEELDVTSQDSELTGRPNGENSTAEEQKWGREFLLEGLGAVIARGRMLAGLTPLSDDEEPAMTEAWYEAVSGAIPCRYWKEIGLWTSRYTDPADKFTLRQFFQAWAKFCEQGRAKGYEPWR